MTLPPGIKDRENNKFVESSTGDVAVRTVLDGGDIEIGAVEIKDAAGTNRASVDSNGALKSVVSQATGSNLHVVVDSGAVTTSGTATVSQATGTNLHTVVDSGSVTAAVTGTVTANISGSISNTSFGATQATGSNLHMVVDSGTISTITNDVKIVQDVIADANNSSTTNLKKSPDSGYVFAGTKTSTLGVAGIQVSLFTTQNCTITVEQSPDATPHWDLVDTYNYYANSNFGVTVQAISSYVRVTVTNLSTTTDTISFRLQTALCPIVEPLPRSLDAYGNLKVAIQQSKDQYGFKAENTPTDDTRTVIPTRLVGAQFDGTTLDTVFWSKAEANSATVTLGGATAVLDTLTTNNGGCVLSSVRRARYVSANSNVFRAVVQLDAGVANNKRRWGVAWGSTMPTGSTLTGISDGAYFQLDGTEFSVNTMKTYTGTTGITKVTTFNGTLGASYSPGTSVLTYEIYWTNSKVWFVVGGEVLHTVSASSATWADTMNHHIYFDNVNSSNANTSVKMYVRVASIRRLGPLLTQPTSYFFPTGTTAGTQLKYGPGNLHELLIFNTTNNAVITLSDSTSTTTPVIFALTSAAQPQPLVIDLKGIPFFNGLRLTVSAQNSAALIIYE